MLYSTTPPAAKRAALRARLAAPGLVRLPGVFNALSARLIERHGFEGVYLSGAVMSAELGLPDLELLTATEVATRAAQVARVTELPLIVDADTGFGTSLAVARTVQALEDAGAAGCHIEDQVSPKRCGHLDGKQVVPLPDAVARVRAAVAARRDPGFVIIARTDVRAEQGVGACIERAKALMDAGADAVFPEALRSAAEFEQVATALDVPVLANMTEFGKSPLLAAADLEGAGVKLVIWPVTLLRLAMKAADEALSQLTGVGSQAALIGRMQTRAELYQLLGYDEYTEFDSRMAGHEPAGQGKESGHHG